VQAYIELLVWLLSRFMATYCGLVFNSFSPLLLFISDPFFLTVQTVGEAPRVQFYKYHPKKGTQNIYMELQEKN
jgi:hypothetical protein